MPYKNSHLVETRQGICVVPKTDNLTYCGVNDYLYTSGRHINHPHATCPVCLSVIRRTSQKPVR